MGYPGPAEIRGGGVRRPIRIARELPIAASPSVILVENDEQLLSALLAASPAVALATNYNPTIRQMLAFGRVLLA